MRTVYPHTVDIAGSAWPVFKLEALAAGLLVALILALVTGSLQAAVLVGAAVAAGRWVLGHTGTRRAATSGRADRMLAAH
ncbi:hypothetical protein [Nocardia goodfellowii]|uniref:Uncharacterized protein n=1 Tax=Nocardia goodfellowii TaxID=882446 RepID=A0ABS4QPR5_9NOCA|nr:hypothetical protein [Nocardia goodfellowii]MBP2193694.1 hypothetical protein [Nocardia goodfellowii]